VVCQVSDIPMVMSHPDTFPDWVELEMAGPSACGSIDDDVVLIELPAGPANIVRGANVCEGLESEEVNYAINSGDRAAAFGCGAPDAPDDDWQSIAETFEFLPKESPSPDAGETLVRFEVPQAGLALGLPESWTVEVEMEEMSRVDMGDGQLISTSILVTYGPMRLPSCGLYTQEVSPAIVGPAWSTTWLEVVRSLFAAEDDFHTTDRLDLPAGDAVKVVHEVALGPEAPADIVEYHIAADDRGLVFFCFTLPPLVPDDDWLSIAQTIETLPVVE